jgi:transposase
VTAGSLPEAPLPVRPRPRDGETADSYLRRLAAANHLRFSYLRRYHAIPRGSHGPVDPGRLAALAGREPDPILRAFPELASPAPGPGGRRYYSRQDIERNRAARREKYAAVRRDIDAGMSERAVERKHHVGRRTIIKALSSAEPPARKKTPREPTALNGLHARIDAMIEEDPGIGTAAIWQHLADDHGVTVAYPTLRTYIVRRRAAQQPPLSRPESMTKPGPETLSGRLR